MFILPRYQEILILLFSVVVKDKKYRNAFMLEVFMWCVFWKGGVGGYAPIYIYFV